MKLTNFILQEGGWLSKNCVSIAEENTVFCTLNFRGRFWVFPRFLSYLSNHLSIVCLSSVYHRALSISSQRAIWRAHSHRFISVQRLSICLLFISLCVFVAVCLYSSLFSWSVLSDSLQPPWTAAHHTCLSYAISQSLLKLMSVESVMPSNHRILCRPLLLPPSIFPSIRVFSNELALHIRHPKCV